MFIFRKCAGGIACAILLSCVPAVASVDPSTVLIVVNDDTLPEAGTGRKGASKYVADVYMAARHVPAANVVHIRFPNDDPKAWDSWHLSFSDFKMKVRAPVQEFLEKKNLKNKIRYIVTVYGVPSHIQQYPGAPEGLSVDSFLAAMFSPNPDELHTRNPYFNPDPKSTPPRFAEAPLPWPMYAVARLDGPTALIAAGLIDKAMTAEKGIDKKSGIAYYDFRHLNTDPPGYYTADLTITSGYELCVAHGFHCVLNDQTKSGHMIDKAPNTLWAWGWYSWDVNDVYTFVPGAVGAQLTSFTANSLRYKIKGAWAPVWLERGITATWGATGEPYTAGYAKGDNLLNHFWNGYNFADSAYIACPQLNWMMVFIGDPLYAPPIK